MNKRRDPYRLVVRSLDEASQFGLKFVTLLSRGLTPLGRRYNRFRALVAELVDAQG